jgi:hypothetical protein
MLNFRYPFSGTYLLSIKYTARTATESYDVRHQRSSLIWVTKCAVLMAALINKKQI